MTDIASFQIQHGLPEVFRLDAARLYEDAFGKKYRPIIGPEAIGIKILEASMDAAYCFTATTAEQLLGVVGYSHEHHQFVFIRLALLVHYFGPFAGLARYAMFVLTNRHPKPGELLMRGIAVHPTARGKGVGTRLLDAIYQFACAHSYRSIRLDVVNTNPHARRLYERVGFVATITRSYPFIRSLGFSAVTTMIRPVYFTGR
jgi:ribosomal protein S18 acetylase RimI-like enzyme